MSDPSRVDRDLDHLYTPFKVLVQSALDLANHDAIDPDTNRPKFPDFSHYGVFEGYRSVSRQKWLYGQGRTRPGKKVTNTPVPGFHGYGLAADVVWWDKEGRPRWDGPSGIWQLWGHCVRAQGLVWGGDWKMGDTPHCQPNASLVVKWRPLAKTYLKNLGLETP